MKCLRGLFVSFRNDLMGGNHLVGDWVTGKGMLEFLILLGLKRIGYIRLYNGWRSGDVRENKKKHVYLTCIMHLYLIGSERKTLLYLNGARRRRVSTGLEHLNLNMVLHLGGWLEGIVCSRRQLYVMEYITEFNLVLMEWLNYILV